MKSCITCKYRKRGFDDVFLGIDSFIKCTHPRTQDRPSAPDIVTGRVYHPRLPYCSIVRQYGPACGPEGLLWEERPKFLSKVFGSKPSKIAWTKSFIKFKLRS